MEASEILAGECPCGGAAVVMSRSPEDETTVVVHTKPYCEHFKKLGHGEYLRWVRGALRGRFDS